MIVPLLFVICLINAHADECTNAEKARLKKEAAKVKMVYEEAVGTEAIESNPDLGSVQTEVEYNYFKISITNITEEMVVKVSNSVDDDSFMVAFHEVENGVYTFNWNNIDEVVNFTYEVMGSYGSVCSNEKFATGHLVTPRYNLLHDTTLCDGITDLPACDKYITENTDQEVLEKRIEEYKVEKKEKESKETKFEKLVSYIKEHKVAAVGLTIIVAGAGVALVINKRRKKAF